MDDDGDKVSLASEGDLESLKNSAEKHYIKKIYIEDSESDFEDLNSFEDQDQEIEPIEKPATCEKLGEDIRTVTVT